MRDSQQGVPNPLQRLMTTGQMNFAFVYFVMYFWRAKPKWLLLDFAYLSPVDSPWFT